MVSKAFHTCCWKVVPAVVNSMSKSVSSPAKYARSWRAISVNAASSARAPSARSAARTPPFWSGTDSEESAVPPFAVGDSSPTSSSSPSGLSSVM